MVDRDDVTREARALGALMGVSGAPLDGALDAMAPHLSTYAELVVTEHGIEVITGGVGDETAGSLARIGIEHGVSPETSAAFLACARAFPGRMLGLKLCFAPSRPGPTLYVRTLAHRGEVLAFLSRLREVASALNALDQRLEGNRTVYGLGFSAHDGALAVKTYSLADVALLGSAARPGFVSWRVAGGALLREAKRYLPDLEWAELPVWPALAREVRARVACDRVGHLGVIESTGGAPEVKLYLERVGAIPTDLSAR